MYNKNINQVLKSGDWCLGDVGYDEYTGKQLSETEKRDLIINGVYFDYDSVYRNQLTNKYISTYKCNGTSMEKFGDETTPMYVGALTIDEIIYSGPGLLAPFYKNYLVNGYQKEQELEFLTLSYTAYDTGKDYVTYLSHIDFNIYELTLIHNCNETPSFRPALTLSKDTKIISGNGTNKKPYIFTV